MPKIKTSRAAAKRFKKTGAGIITDATNFKNMKKILPYL